jgi:hypothetical protein
MDSYTQFIQQNIFSKHKDIGDDIDAVSFLSEKNNL